MTTTLTQSALKEWSGGARAVAEMHRMRRGLQLAADEKQLSGAKIPG